MKPQLPLLEAEETLFSQLLPVHYLLQPPDHLDCPLLGSLHHVNILVPTAPKLDTVLQIWSYMWPNGGEGSLLWSLTNTAQDAALCLCCKGAVVAHIQLVQQDLQMLFCRATSQSAILQSVLLNGATSC